MLEGSVSLLLKVRFAIKRVLIHLPRVCTAKARVPGVLCCTVIMEIVANCSQIVVSSVERFHLYLPTTARKLRRRQRPVTYMALKTSGKYWKALMMLSEKAVKSHISVLSC